MKLNTKSLADVQLGTPLLAEGMYFVRIRPDGVKVEPNRNKDGQVLKLTLNILNETVNSYEDNKELDNHNGNMTLWGNISLTETLNEDGSVRYDPNIRLKEIGLAIGMAEEDLEDLEVADLQGSCCKVQLKHRPAKDGYNAANEIGRYLPIAADDDFEEPAF